MGLISMLAHGEAAETKLEEVLGIMTGLYG